MFLKERAVEIWIVVIALLVGLGAGARSSWRPARWPHVNDLGPARVFDAPAFLAYRDTTALLWRPLEPTATLVYESLEPSRARIPILPYPDVAPRRWQVAPGGPTTYHVIWQEADGRLRSALVNTDGQTARGPVELVPTAVADFETIPAHGRLTVFWIGARDSQVGTLTLDTEGRPGMSTVSLVGQVERIAAAPDQTGAIHLIWLTSPEPGQWMVNYQRMTPETSLLDNPVQPHTFSLAPDEALASFALGLDRTHAYAIWGITTADRPDSERVVVLSFPLDQPQTSLARELRLPQHATPSIRIVSADVSMGRIAPVSASPARPAALRWPRPLSGQRDLLPITLALKTADGWRPAVAYFQQGRSLGYQIVAPVPADAGPPALTVDPGGNLRVAWTGLRGSFPHLYVASTGGHEQGDGSSPPLARTLSGALIGIILGLVWLALPTALIVLAPPQTWAFALALALYGAAKLVWPPGLLDRLPPLLRAFEANDPQLITGVTVGVIGLISGAALILAFRANRPRWQSWLLFALLDVTLTGIVFGANALP
jgi:hypothetical protein